MSIHAELPMVTMMTMKRYPIVYFGGMNLMVVRGCCSSSSLPYAGAVIIKIDYGVLYFKLNTLYKLLLLMNLLVLY